MEAFLNYTKNNPKSTKNIKAIKTTPQDLAAPINISTTELDTPI